MNDPTDPVSCAVEKCLAYATQFDSPAVAAADFIALLKVGHTLDDDEIAEVNSRVTAELANRAFRAKG